MTHSRHKQGRTMLFSHATSSVAEHYYS